MDGMSRQYCNVWEFLLRGAANSPSDNLNDEDSVIIDHIMRVLSPSSNENDRQESWNWLKRLSMPTRNHVLNAFIVFALGVTSIDGHLPASSTELGDVNDHMNKLSQQQSLDADFLRIILCAASDRWDLALETANTLSGTLEESMTVQLAHFWKAMIRGLWSEAYLCLEDIETLLNLSKGEDTPYFLKSLKALTRLHEGDSEETVLLIGNDAEDPAALINLAAAHQRLGNREEAQIVTEKLKKSLSPSHPYLQPLKELEELAANA